MSATVYENGHIISQCNAFNFVVSINTPNKKTTAPIRTLDEVYKRSANIDYMYILLAVITITIAFISDVYIKYTAC